MSETPVRTFCNLMSAFEKPSTPHLRVGWFFGCYKCGILCAYDSRKTVYSKTPYCHFDIHSVVLGIVRARRVCIQDKYRGYHMTKTGTILTHVIITVAIMTVGYLAGAGSYFMLYFWILSQ